MNDPLTAVDIDAHLKLRDSQPVNPLDWLPRQRHDEDFSRRVLARLGCALAFTAADRFRMVVSHLDRTSPLHARK